MTPQELKKTCRYLVGAARRVWRWNSDRREVNLESERLAGKKGQRICASCKKRYNRKGVHVDHVQPVGTAPTAFEGWDAYYIKLFTPRENLQALCSTCHKAKTKLEAKARAALRKAA